MLKKKDFKFSCILHLTHSKFEHSPSLCHFTSFPLHCRFFSAPGINKSGPLSPTSSLCFALPYKAAQPHATWQKNHGWSAGIRYPKEGEREGGTKSSFSWVPEAEGGFHIWRFHKSLKFWLTLQPVHRSYCVYRGGGGLSVARFQR